MSRTRKTKSKISSMTPMPRRKDESEIFFFDDLTVEAPDDSMPSSTTTHHQPKAVTVDESSFTRMNSRSLSATRARPPSPPQVSFSLQPSSMMSALASTPPVAPRPPRITSASSSGDAHGMIFTSLNSHGAGDGTSQRPFALSQLNATHREVWSTTTTLSTSVYVPDQVTIRGASEIQNVSGAGRLRGFKIKGECVSPNKLTLQECHVENFTVSGRGSLHLHSCHLQGTFDVRGDVEVFLHSCTSENLSLSIRDSSRLKMQGGTGASSLSVESSGRVQVHSVDAFRVLSIYDTSRVEISHVRQVDSVIISGLSTLVLSHLTRLGQLQVRGQVCSVLLSHISLIDESPSWDSPCITRFSVNG